MIKSRWEMSRAAKRRKNLKLATSFADKHTKNTKWGLNDERHTKAITSNGYERALSVPIFEKNYA